MKVSKFTKLACVAACVTLFAATLPASDAEGGLRYTITVTKFENQAGWAGQWDIGDAWGLVLTDLLKQSGRFIVVAETDMRSAALDEQDLAASGRTAGGEKAPVTGQMTPAQLLVKGAITHVQNSTEVGRGGISLGRIRLGGGGGKGEVNATIYIVDATTGQVLASQKVVGESTRKGLGVGYSGYGFSGDFAAFQNDNVGKAVEAACAEAVDFLVAQLPEVPFTGSVVLVKGDQIYINRGEREGVTTGMEFIIGDTEVIRDPDTGEVLDTSMEEMARVKVVTVKEKLSICVVTEGDVGRVRKGMGVQTP